MFENNCFDYPYASKRMLSFAKNGMVAASQPLAAQAGLEMLKQGGNAVDAAIASAAMLTVVEPTGCGIGGDAFAIVWMKGELHGLNASSFAPAALTADRVKNEYGEMPLYGWLPVTIPGIPAAWQALSERFGRLPFKTLLAPAIKTAEEGFPVTPTIQHLWDKAIKLFDENLNTNLKQSWLDTFTLSGRAPKAGEVFKMPHHAKTLTEIAQTNSKSFYEGALAEKIAAYAATTNGTVTTDDLARYQVEWVDPISINYRGYDIWEIPPNGQGMVALMALNMLKHDTFTHRDALETIHTQCEAMKLAYADGQAYITQRDKMSVSVEALLSDRYANERRALIQSNAIQPIVGKPDAGGTVYLATADADGNMVSFIQSNYHGFGSGVVIPETGIAMQNRGHNFSLDPAHDNFLEPYKKTYHTIIPGFITKNNQALGPFGVMGGFMQPQGHMQVIMNMIDFGLNPQAALDAPRWQWLGDMTVGLEFGFSENTAMGMLKKGHVVEVTNDYTSYGRGQIILRHPDTAVYYGGTEPRTDSSIALY